MYSDRCIAVIHQMARNGTAGAMVSLFNWDFGGSPGLVLVMNRRTVDHLCQKRYCLHSADGAELDEDHLNSNSCWAESTSREYLRITEKYPDRYSVHYRGWMSSLCLGPKHTCKLLEASCRSNSLTLNDSHPSHVMGLWQVYHRNLRSDGSNFKLNITAPCLKKSAILDGMERHNGVEREYGPLVATVKDPVLQGESGPQIGRNIGARHGYFLLDDRDTQA